MTTKKANTAADASGAAAEIPTEPTDAGENAPPPADPGHQWPAAGGCYVRQEDGTLKRED